MVDPILERIANKDGSLSVEQLIQEVINVRAERDALAAKVDEAQAAAVTLSFKLGTAEDRVKMLTEAIDRLFSLVQDKSQPLTSPENQALINAGDTISVNEGNLWNLRWILMAHSPSPTKTTADPYTLRFPNGD